MAAYGAHRWTTTQLLSHVPAQVAITIAPPPTPATDVRPLLSSSHPPPSLLPSLSLSIRLPHARRLPAHHRLYPGDKRRSVWHTSWQLQPASGSRGGGGWGRVGSGGVARSAGVIRSLRNLRRSHLTTIVLTTQRLDSNTSTPWLHGTVGTTTTTITKVFCLFSDTYYGLIPGLRRKVGVFMYVWPPPTPVQSRVDNNEGSAKSCKISSRLQNTLLTGEKIVYLWIRQHVAYLTPRGGCRRRCLWNILSRFAPRGSPERRWALPR